MSLGAWKQLLLGDESLQSAAGTVGPQILTSPFLLSTLRLCFGLVTVRRQHSSSLLRIGFTLDAHTIEPC